MPEAETTAHATNCVAKRAWVHICVIDFHAFIICKGRSLWLVFLMGAYCLVAQKHHLSIGCRKDSDMAQHKTKFFFVKNLLNFEFHWICEQETLFLIQNLYKIKKQVFNL